MDQLIKVPRSKVLKNLTIALKPIREYRGSNERFEIRIDLPQHFRIINRYKNMETALPDYEEMLKMIGKGTPEEIQEFKGRFYL